MQGKWKKNEIRIFDEITFLMPLKYFQMNSMLNLTQKKFKKMSKMTLIKKRRFFDFHKKVLISIISRARKF